MIKHFSDLGDTSTRLSVTSEARMMIIDDGDVDFVSLPLQIRNYRKKDTDRPTSKLAKQRQTAAKTKTTAKQTNKQTNREFVPKNNTTYIFYCDDRHFSLANNPFSCLCQQFTQLTDHATNTLCLHPVQGMLIIPLPLRVLTQVWESRGTASVALLASPCRRAALLSIAVIHIILAG